MKRILIFETEDLTANFLKEKLEQVGYETLIAKTSEQVIDIFKKDKVNLMILSDSLENVFLKLRDIKQKFNVPIIMILNSNQPEQLKKIDGLVKDVIFKTDFSIKAIILKVRKLI